MVDIGVRSCFVKTGISDGLDMFFVGLYFIVDIAGFN